MSETSARASRFAFWFGSLARNGFSWRLAGAAPVAGVAVLVAAAGGAGREAGGVVCRAASGIGVGSVGGGAGRGAAGGAEGVRHGRCGRR